MVLVVVGGRQPAVLDVSTDCILNVAGNYCALACRLVSDADASLVNKFDRVSFIELDKALSFLLWREVDQVVARRRLEVHQRLFNWVERLRVLP